MKEIVETKQEEEEQGHSCGVIYVGHLPYGFFEKELSGFFTQFGEVTGVKVSRSKKVTSLLRRLLALRALDLWSLLTKPWHRWRPMQCMGT